MDAKAKRVFDVLLASAILIFSSPLLIGVAAAIRFTSPGPVLYKGLRVGKEGVPFRMYKFRSMTSGADRSGPGITAGDDPRITRVGRVLRSTKTDELPQLLNVLRGDMSLVGPRPEAPEYVNLADERQRTVLSLRPGITGPSQLYYRHEEKLLDHADVEQQYRTKILPLKLESDLKYVQERSFLGDVRIVMQTARRLVQR